MTLRLAVPSKGRLMEKTLAWFGARGLALRRSAEAREYAIDAHGAPVELVMLAAGEIPRELAAGRVHLGVTGADMVRERLVGWNNAVIELDRLGFGHADLVVAVPRFWVDVDTLDDLDAAAWDFRRRHGTRLRIATKYHRLVREFLTEAGVADYLLVDSQGATEATVRNGTAEAIADITTTGETLRANRLKVLTDGVILRSQATLFKATGAAWDGPAVDAFHALERLLGTEHA
jgi:ATP phosphoribosyltransferase